MSSKPRRATAAAAAVQQQPSVDIAPFIAELWDIVDKSEGGLVSWTSNGQSFVVYDCDRFASAVLEKRFKSSNFSSFVRQLNYYSFRKDNKTGRGQDARVWTFSHIHFIRDRPDLLPSIRRKTAQDYSQKSETETLRAEVDELRSSNQQLRTALLLLHDALLAMPAIPGASGGGAEALAELCLPDEALAAIAQQREALAARGFRDPVSAAVAVTGGGTGTARKRARHHISSGSDGLLGTGTGMMDGGDHDDGMDGGGDEYMLSYSTGTGTGSAYDGSHSHHHHHHNTRVSGGAAASGGAGTGTGSGSGSTVTATVVPSRVSTRLRTSTRHRSALAHDDGGMDEEEEGTGVHHRGTGTGTGGDDGSMMHHQAEGMDGAGVGTGSLPTSAGRGKRATAPVGTGKGGRTQRTLSMDGAEHSASASASTTTGTASSSHQQHGDAYGTGIVGTGNNEDTSDDDFSLGDEATGNDRKSTGKSTPARNGKRSGASSRKPSIHLTNNVQAGGATSTTSTSSGDVHASGSQGYAASAPTSLGSTVAASSSHAFAHSTGTGNNVGTGNNYSASLLHRAPQLQVVVSNEDSAGMGIGSVTMGMGMAMGMDGGSNSGMAATSASALPPLATGPQLSNSLSMMEMTGGLGTPIGTGNMMLGRMGMVGAPLAHGQHHDQSHHHQHPHHHVHPSAFPFEQPPLPSSLAPASPHSSASSSMLGLWRMPSFTQAAAATSTGSLPDGSNPYDQHFQQQPLQQPFGTGTGDSGYGVTPTGTGTGDSRFFAFADPSTMRLSQNSTGTGTGLGDLGSPLASLPVPPPNTAAQNDGGFGMHHKGGVSAADHHAFLHHSHACMHTHNAHMMHGGLPHRSLPLSLHASTGGGDEDGDDSLLLLTAPPAKSSGSNASMAGAHMMGSASASASGTAPGGSPAPTHQHQQRCPSSFGALDSDGTGMVGTGKAQADGSLSMSPPDTVTGNRSLTLATPQLSACFQGMSIQQSPPHLHGHEHRHQQRQATEQPHYNHHQQQQQATLASPLTLFSAPPLPVAASATAPALVSSSSFGSYRASTGTGSAPHSPDQQLHGTGTINGSLSGRDSGNDVRMGGGGQQARHNSYPLPQSLSNPSIGASVASINAALATGGSSERSRYILNLPADGTGTGTRSGHDSLSNSFSGALPTTGRISTGRSTGGTPDPMNQTLAGSTGLHGDAPTTPQRPNSQAGAANPGGASSQRSSRQTPTTGMRSPITALVEARLQQLAATRGSAGSPAAFRAPVGVTNSSLAAAATGGVGDGSASARGSPVSLLPVQSVPSSGASSSYSANTSGGLSGSSVAITAGLASLPVPVPTAAVRPVPVLTGFSHPQPRSPAPSSSASSSTSSSSSSSSLSFSGSGLVANASAFSPTAASASGKGFAGAASNNNQAGLAIGSSSAFFSPRNASIGSNLGLSGCSHAGLPQGSGKDAGSVNDAPSMSSLRQQPSFFPVYTAQAAHGSTGNDGRGMVNERSDSDQSRRSVDDAEGDNDDGDGDAQMGGGGASSGSGAGSAAFTGRTTCSAAVTGPSEGIGATRLGTGTGSGFYVPPIITTAMPSTTTITSAATTSTTDRLPLLRQVICKQLSPFQQGELVSKLAAMLCRSSGSGTLGATTPGSVASTSSVFTPRASLSTASATSIFPSTGNSQAANHAAASILHAAWAQPEIAALCTSAGLPTSWSPFDDAPTILRRLCTHLPADVVLAILLPMPHVQACLAHVSGALAQAAAAAAGTIAIALASAAAATSSAAAANAVSIAWGASQAAGSVLVRSGAGTPLAASQAQAAQAASTAATKTGASLAAVGR